MTPSDITQSWLEALRDKIPSDRTYYVYGAIHDLRKLDGFGHLNPLRKRTERTGVMSEKIAPSLEVLISDTGLSSSSRRKVRLAVNILAETSEAEQCKTLDNLLEIQLNDVEWGTTEKQIVVHVGCIRTLKRFHSLPWTPAWRLLHELVVNAGITMSKNPVPKVLSWNPGCDPAGLTLEWAKTTDLKLRATLTNPPHGTLRSLMNFTV